MQMPAITRITTICTATVHPHTTIKLAELECQVNTPALNNQTTQIAGYNTGAVSGSVSIGSAMPTVAIVTSNGQANLYNAADFGQNTVGSLQSAFRGGSAGDYLNANIEHLIPVKVEMKNDKELSGECL